MKGCKRLHNTRCLDLNYFDNLIVHVKLLRKNVNKEVYLDIQSAEQFLGDVGITPQVGLRPQDALQSFSLSLPHQSPNLVICQQIIWKWNELNISSYIGFTIYQGENHLQKIFLLLLDLHYLLLVRLASHRPVSSGRETWNMQLVNFLVGKSPEEIIITWRVAR